MPGDPHSGSKVWKAPDREIGKPGENRGKAIAHRDSQPAAALHDRENRRDLRSCHWAADVQPILSTKSYPGRMEFSARLVLTSNSGYSKKRVSFFHSASAYRHALLSALEAKQRTALPRSCRGYHREEFSPFPDPGCGAPQLSSLCGELPHRSQTVRPSEPQSGLQPGLGDLAEPLRKTVFWHETNKRHVPFLAHRLGHRFIEPRFKCAPLDESRKFRQICRVAFHDHLDSANSGPLRSRFIYRLNRGREHPALLDDSI